ncbi:hypothetical protein [Parendozoicomonas haliclonae]|uniref:hypothetical protein n=1 Tax=Parendozoicomonas haliclonae TaxID=1960125 RepID=UPI0013FDCE06|nr:hypothetical protein [Parendozoicomonas haliclonae]
MARHKPQRLLAATRLEPAMRLENNGLEDKGIGKDPEVLILVIRGPPVCGDFYSG